MNTKPSTIIRLPMHGKGMAAELKPQAADGYVDLPRTERRKIAKQIKALEKHKMRKGLRP